ncbi:MAG: sigma 54-interacting transcriptional regulator [Deltaproteobacteria bacterium]|nr:sigma 54-interacting transcriptional regulator [Deltaproteobacteria bacterium]
MNNINKGSTFERSEQSPTIWAAPQFDDLNRVDNMLGKPEERHRTILEGIEEGYVEVDLKGSTVFCNDSFCNITGYPRKELIGLNFRAYVTESMADRVYKAYNKVYRRGIPDPAFYYEIIQKSGVKRIIENSISLIETPEGRRIGFRSIVRDITDRKRMEEELERHRSRLQAIFRSVRDAIITVDTKMVLIEANEATESICDISNGECVGKPFGECPTRCNQACHEVLSDSLKKKMEIKGYRIECKRHDRPEQTVIITSSPLLDREGEFTGTVLVVRDITRLSNLERELREKHQFHNIIGKSRNMQDIYSLLENLVGLDTTVLITGESGTGKSLVAKALHHSGSRAFGPLITVNCSALPENLLESELFGHVKGAFTGAIKDVQGRFQAAGQGTILLDEIGDISPRIQLKLLRVLEEKEFERVGESLARKVDARVIACTNRDLQEKVRLGEFREDLYYRLKVIEVHLPPLRERLDDIPLLIAYFCKVFNNKFKKNVEGLADEVVRAFMNYHWPGNVRELEHSLEHAFVLCREPIITLDHIPAEIMGSLGVRKRSHEQKILSGSQEILTALEKTDWNKAKAARILGIDRSTLYRRIRRHKLSASKADLLRDATDM